MASNGNSGCAKVSLMLGAIASLITIVIFITGKESIPEFAEDAKPQKSTATVQPAQSPRREQPTFTPTTRREQPTFTPTAHPTNTSIPRPSATKTPIPTSTPLPNTRSGTILEVGQSWWQDGLELALAKMETGYSKGGWTLAYGEGSPTIGIEVQFELTNHKSQGIALRYNLGRAISAVSNQGRPLEVGYLDRSVFYVGGGEPWENSFETITTVVESGQTIKLINRGGYWGDPRIFIKADITDLSLTEIIISVSGISTITEARWRVPVYH